MTNCTGSFLFDWSESRQGIGLGMVQCSTYSVARVDGTWWVAGCILRVLKGKDEFQVLPPNGWSGAMGVENMHESIEPTQ